jgi:uncharacterized protein YbbK (DUF523 family)
VIGVLVSACLLGVPVRYHGGAARCESAVLERWQAEGRVVPLCPEVAGGLPTPRAPAEIEPGAAALSVLRGQARVRTSAGVDVTEAFAAGARAAALMVGHHGIGIAILKDGSPSCATSFTYDGRFSGARVPGMGVTAAVLVEAGVQVFSESELDAADRALAALEVASGR